MSGGHFDYKQAYLGYIADQLKHDIKYNDIPYIDAQNTENYDDYGHQLEPKTIVFIKKIAEQLNNLEKILREYDLAVSGDTCEETFQERMGIK